MLAHRVTRRWRTAATFLVGLGLVMVGMVPASAATPTLTADLKPGSANPGKQTPFVLTVSSDQGSLQTLTLDAPSNFNVDLESVVLSSGTLSGSSTPTKIVVGGIKISGSDVLSASFDGYPACTADTYTWTLNGTQKGGTGYAEQNFLTTVSGSSSCKLLFGPIADQLSEAAFPVPADAAFPVSVAVVRENDSFDPTFRGQASLTIETDPGTDDAILTDRSPPPPATVPPTEAIIDGVATFSTSLNFAGTGYELEACSPTVNSACDPSTGNGGRFLSEAFAVYDDVNDCPRGQSCFANASAALQVSTQVSATNGPDGEASIKAGVFAVPAATPGSFDPSNLDCAGYDEITEVIASFDFTGPGIKTVVNTVSAEQMKEIANQGVSFLQVCFGSSIQFEDRLGPPGHLAPFDDTLGLYVGLLKECPSNKKNLAASAPCVVSRQGGGTGTGTITYVAEDGDPGGSRH
jgi:hypothetical protein